MPRILTYPFLWIWQFSKYFEIPLGRFAPYVFGGMVGRWPRRVKQ